MEAFLLPSDSESDDIGFTTTNTQVRPSMTVHPSILPDHTPPQPPFPSTVSRSLREATIPAQRDPPNIDPEINYVEMVSIFC